MSTLTNKCHSDTLLIFDLLLYVVKVHKSFVSSSKRNPMLCGIYHKKCSSLIHDEAVSIRQKMLIT